METALRQFLRRHTQYEGLHFYGYSGGGVLATLLAARFASTRRLVTIAAPLDLDGWTRLHGFTALTGSIDPMTQPPLPASIRQLHLAGGSDRIVPGDLIRRFAARQTRSARFAEVTGFDHHCCWLESWQTVVLQQ
jgi:pimeloyl-ACP methyl ester carboxylesterase